MDRCRYLIILFWLVLVVVLLAGNFAVKFMHSTRMDFTVKKNSLFQNALNKYVQNFPLRLPHFEIPLLVLVHVGAGPDVSRVPLAKSE